MGTPESCHVSSSFTATTWAISLEHTSWATSKWPPGPLACLLWRALAPFLACCRREHWLGASLPLLVIPNPWLVHGTTGARCAQGGRKGLGYKGQSSAGCSTLAPTN